MWINFIHANKLECKKGKIIYYFQHRFLKYPEISTQEFLCQNITSTLPAVSEIFQGIWIRNEYAQMDWGRIKKNLWPKGTPVCSKIFFFSFYPTCTGTSIWLNIQLFDLEIFFWSVTGKSHLSWKKF